MHLRDSFEKIAVRAFKARSCVLIEQGMAQMSAISDLMSLSLDGDPTISEDADLCWWLLFERRCPREELTQIAP